MRDRAVVALLILPGVLAGCQIDCPLVVEFPLDVVVVDEASGEPIGGRPGEDGMGTIAQGALEASNVKLVEEMVNLMVAQRAYEASVKVVQASDEMLGMINGLRR